MFMVSEIHETKRDLATAIDATGHVVNAKSVVTVAKATNTVAPGIANDLYMVEKKLTEVEI